MLFIIIIIIIIIISVTEFVTNIKVTVAERIHSPAVGILITQQTFCFCLNILAHQQDAQQAKQKHTHNHTTQHKKEEKQTKDK